MTEFEEKEEGIFPKLEAARIVTECCQDMLEHERLALCQRIEDTICDWGNYMSDAARPPG